MRGLTYLQVLEINNKKEECITYGKQYEKDNIQYDKYKFSNYEIIFIEFGKFCLHHDLDSDNYFNYEIYLECGSWDWNIDNKQYESIDENRLYTFLRRLKTGEYEAIIVDERTPLILEDKSSMEFWENQLYCDIVDSIVEVGYDTLKIINKSNNEVILLEGLEKMSNEEIFARRYLDRCECGLIIKDDLAQVDLREYNFVNSEDYYDKCKGIINIRTVAEDNEHYKMNWDCIIVAFSNGIEQIWQRN